MRVAMELADGRRWEAEANRRTLFGLASKSAFKKQFGVPSVVFGLWAGAIDEDGDLDLANVPPEQLQHFDEEYMAFMAWCELKRRCDDVPQGPWDRLIDDIVDVTLDMSDDDEDGEDPTSAATST